MRRVQPFCLLLLLGVTGCYSIAVPEQQGLSTFQVQVKGVFVYTSSGARIPLPAVQECISRYGGSSKVPAEVRGTPECRYQIPRAEVEVDLVATALDGQGNPMTDVNKPISFRVVPGDLTGDYGYRWSMMQGGVAQGTIKAAHLYAETRFWAEDAPPQPIFADGGMVGADGGPTGTAPLPVEPAVRTYAAGVSSPVWFEEPTLAKIQFPDNFDNRNSPFVGEFITVGKTPESGSLLKMSCPDDPSHNGQISALVVTGIDPAGFFVTDLNSCRLKEDLTDSTGKVVTRIPEPDGFYPGTFGSLYVYNYSYPEGLNQGDLLWTVSGSMQEFTSTTQMTFASWTVREKVRLLPEAQWNKYLDQVKPVEINARTCNLDTTLFLTDALCGHNKVSMKMESLESGLVKLRNVKFPEVFKNCDFNSSGQVPFFCETKPGSTWFWGSCGDPVTPDPDLPERQCNIDCTIGLNAFANRICSEESTYRNFGQFVVELPGPGPLEANLDPSIPQRMKTVTVSNVSRSTSGTAAVGVPLKLFCTVPTHYRFGGTSAVAALSDPLLPANTVVERAPVTGESKVAFLAEGSTQGTCTVGENPRTRILLTLTDVLPDINVNCNPEDPDAVAAQECVKLRAARYDVVGHLRHVQPARPRWMVMPRDADDVCCHPGQGLSCPKLIKPCPGG